MIDELLTKMRENKLEPKDILMCFGMALVASSPKIFRLIKRGVSDRARNSRIYDHSVNQYIYLARPMTKAESRKYIELRDRGYSVRDAVSMLGLRRRDYRRYDL